MKSNAKAILILVMVFLLVLPGSAAAGDGIQVELNGEKLLFDVPPAMVSGRVLVPLRAVFEALDVVPEWDPETQTVEASSGEKIIRLSIGSRQAMVGGDPVELDVPGQLIRGRTLVPIRFIAESLGAEVNWNSASSRVEILKKMEVPEEDLYEGAAGLLTGKTIREAVDVEISYSESWGRNLSTYTVIRERLPESIRERVTRVSSTGTSDGDWNDEMVEHQASVFQEWYVSGSPQRGSTVTARTAYYQRNLIFLRDDDGKPLAYFIIQ